MKGLLLSICHIYRKAYLLSILALIDYYCGRTQPYLLAFRHGALL